MRCSEKQPLPPARRERRERQRRPRATRKTSKLSNVTFKKINQLIINVSIPHKINTSIYLHKGLYWKRPSSFVIVQSWKQAQGPSTVGQTIRASASQTVEFSLKKTVPKFPLSSGCFVLDCSSRNTFKLRLSSARSDLLFTWLQYTFHLSRCSFHL